MLSSFSRSGASRVGVSTYGADNDVFGLASSFAGLCRVVRRSLSIFQAMYLQSWRCKTTVF